MRPPQTGNMIILRLCADLPNPSPAPSGRTTCDCCDEDCWLSKGSIDLLAVFPQLTTLCIECANAVNRAFPPSFVANVPHNDRELRFATSLLTATGEQQPKRGQS